ncbi:MAG: hypothetical protein ACSLEY_01900 [Candidatus Saccharimonadales bacterium]
MEPEQQQIPDASEMPQETPLELVPATMEEEPVELPEIEPVQWQAPEYLQHDKSPLWYVVFALVVIALMAGAVFVQAWTFVVLIPIMAIALLVYSHRPPHEFQYSVGEHGIHINDQLHPVSEFKAFGVMQEHGTNVLVLIPVKRFNPSLAVYFPVEVGEALVDTLGAYVPMQDVHPDLFDRIVSKLRI